MYFPKSGHIGHKGHIGTKYPKLELIKSHIVTKMNPYLPSLS